MAGFVFRTQGDWDSTTLQRDDEELAATRLFVELKAEGDAWGDPLGGGVANGGSGSAFVVEAREGRRLAVFPGSLEVFTPGHHLRVENGHPEFLFEETRIIYNGQDVSRSLVELFLDVDAEENRVEGRLVCYRKRWLGRDEVVTTRLF